MGKAELKNHTKDYIHINRKTVLDCIIFLIVFGIIYGLDIILITAPDAKLTIEFILAVQVLAILLVILSLIYVYFDSEGNFIG